MQTQSIRNPAGWLHAALKNGYTFSPPHHSAVEESVQLQSVKESSSKKVPSSASSPIRFAPDAAETKKKQEMTQILQGYLDGEKGEGGDFAREFLRRKNAQERASPL